MENSYYAQYHTSAEVESIFAQVFGSRLTFCGFESIGPRRWVQETGNGFKYFFFLNTGNNGYSYVPCGAISLDFVPRLVAGKLKIRPKSKNVAVHYSFEHKGLWSWSIDKNRENFREKVDKIAGESVPEITEWFQRFKSLNDIVAAIDLNKSRSKERGFYCYPLTVLAYSFALARVHRIDDAKAEFERVCQSKYWEDVLPELQKLFEAEVRSANF